jgi:hypothetical protein
MTDIPKVVTPVALVLAGVIVVLIAVTGTVLVGTAQPYIAEPELRLGLGVFGIVLTLLGCFFYWSDRYLSKLPGASSSNASVTDQIAADIVTELKRDVRWATEALEQAKLMPPVQSVFAERLSQFREEKEYLAEQFVPLLLQRCRVFAESGKQVYLIVDSGTTFRPFLGKLGQVAVNCRVNGEQWLDNINIVTNNLPGVATLFETGRLNPNSRYSALAVNCQLLPGVPLPVYSAVAGEETNEALQRLRSKAGDNAVFIGLVTGNWIRLRGTVPICPVPLARGRGHREFKQKLIDNSDEVYAVAPLGKIFIGVQPEDVNKALGFSAAYQDPDRQPYDEVEITNDKAAFVKIVTTYRGPGYVLSELSTRVRAYTDSLDAQNIAYHLKRFSKASVLDIPHILFPFNKLPQDWFLQIETEFPRNHTRNDTFMRQFFFAGTPLAHRHEPNLLADGESKGHISSAKITAPDKSLELSEQITEYNFLAVVRALVEEENIVVVGQTYAIQAGISGEPLADTSTELNTGIPSVIPITILVHSNSEHVDILSDWHKKIDYSINMSKAQLVDFTFRANVPGKLLFSVDFYYNQRWLRTVKYTFDAVNH